MDQIDSQPALQNQRSSVDDFEKLERDIKSITAKIIEKSCFLLRFTVPEEWQDQPELQNLKEESGEGEAQPSENQEKERKGSIQNKEWSKKLSQWRSMQ